MKDSVVNSSDRPYQIIEGSDRPQFLRKPQAIAPAKLLRELIKKQEGTGSSIVASTYLNIMGTPALFHKVHFNELSMLDGDRGAKFLIKKYAKSLQTVYFPKGGIDIDTIEDYTNLVK